MRVLSSIMLISFVALSTKAVKQKTLHIPKSLSGASGIGAIVPRTEGQRLYLEALQNKNTSILVGLGPAGTGKTMFSCNAAMDGFLSGTYQKIVLTRPVVSVEEEIGFLPGSLVQKMDPWTRPIFDIFLERFSKVKLDSMIQTGIIEISPLGYMRGRTFKNTFIIADEMQNSSPMQMKMMTTRIGENSKMVITGDLNQSDRCEKNGLVDLVERLRKKTVGGGVEFHDKMIDILELSNSDIQRSPVVRRILDIYDNSVGVDVGARGKSNVDFSVGEHTDSYGDAAMIPLSSYKPLKK
jgi:phosphate starvation-inducible PhoH-like protein